VTRALNELLSSPTSSLRLGKSAVFTFWTREQANFNLLALFNDPQPEAVKALLESPRTAKTIEVEDTAFYATVLSGSGGRAVVRDWMDTTVGKVQENLRRWFQRQRIVDPYGEEPRPLGIVPLAGATVRELRDLPPTLLPLLLRAALLGKPLPPDLLATAIGRCKVGTKGKINRREHVTRAQAALIKLCLLGTNGYKEDSMQQLARETPAAAYQCGRLMAVLERAQEAAIPGINSTIVDRFFGTASTAPASVFSRLVRGAQPHLAKLRRDNPGAYGAIQRELEETVAEIRRFPKVLTLEQQGLFALGYYHQRAASRAQARAASERRKVAGQQANDGQAKEE
jgi:CRISPR-associated protein Csd1